jgi:NADH-quinone oxidoreductase subunit I
MGANLLMSEYFNQIIYGVKSFITGMKLTLKHFNQKKDLVATLQYPHEKWPIPERNIGFDHSEYNLIRSRLHVDIDDCIACMQCERVCPVDCIKIDFIKPPKDDGFDCGMTSNDTQKKMIVSRFTIDMSECMYCNLCVNPCPEECIYMVGGPNAEKHEIDYEFSQYKRDGMIFEFADATDDEIRDAGGETWIESRDAKLAKYDDGRELKGIVMEKKSEPVVSMEQDIDEKVSNPKTKITKSDQLEIQSFNDIADKMCRGIAKKAYMTGKRNGLDHIAILASVAQALSDYGKLNDDIQKTLNVLSGKSESSEMEKTDLPSEQAVEEKKVTIDDNISNDLTIEIDIKDLNAIEDKMVRGIAKKAFVAAKKSGGNKVELIKSAIDDAGKMDESIKELLDNFSNNNVNLNDVENDASDEVEYKSSSAVEIDIKDLNAIEDKMVRGIAKKAFVAAKRTGDDKMSAIKTAIHAAGKMDESVEDVLNKLEGG